MALVHHLLFPQTGNERPTAELILYKTLTGCTLCNDLIKVPPPKKKCLNVLINA